MTEERRRRGGAGLSTWTPMQQIFESVEAAGQAESGSVEARGHAVRALFELVTQLAPALDPKLTARLDPTMPPQDQRAQLVEVIQLLNDAMVFPAMEALSIDLQELDRGVTSPRLKGKAGGRRGGLSGTSELAIMREIVEAADALREISSDDLDYRARLEQLACAYSTVEDHRRRLAAGPIEFRKPRSYILAHGQRAPVDLLRDALRQLAAVRRAETERREKRK